MRTINFYETKEKDPYLFNNRRRNSQSNLFGNKFISYQFNWSFGSFFYWSRNGKIKAISLKGNERD